MSLPLLAECFQTLERDANPRGLPPWCRTPIIGKSPLNRNWNAGSFIIKELRRSPHFNAGLPTPVARWGAFKSPHQDAGYANIRGFTEGGRRATGEELF
jgi:hypothetical protein